MSEKKYIVTKSQLQRIVRKTLALTDIDIKEDKLNDENYYQQDIVEKFMKKKFGAKVKTLLNAMKSHNKEVDSIIKDIEKLNDKYPNLNIDTESLGNDWYVDPISG